MSDGGVVGENLHSYLETSLYPPMSQGTANGVSPALRPLSSRLPPARLRAFLDSRLAHKLSKKGEK
jgi:hypothetical protein